MSIHLGGKRLLTKSVLAAAAFVGFLTLTAAPRASAYDYDGCQRRIAKADHRLHEAIEDHGYYSRQANHARHELREARERCWKENRRWWDEDGHRWRNDHDWDDHDHDHYRDRY